VTWVTKFFRDITEQRLLEDQYLRQQRTSFASQLAIAVAHQLRNPLGVMIGFAEMLSRGMPPDQLPSVIDRILRNGIRCKEIVQDLLEFGRVGPGERVPVDVNAILRERVLPLYPGSAASRITWRLADEASPHSLSPFDKLCAKRGAVVQCAPDQLAQVFINLVDNALDDAKSSVIVETFARDDMVYVKVWDDGPGVPEEIRERIFEPFFTTRKEAGGVGLGLCLSRSVVQEHRGSLYLEETASPGGIERDTAGACFVVQLPCAQHEESARTDERKPEPPPRAGRRVIIVEDEMDLLFLLAMALQTEGHEVDCANTGAQAMELLQTGAYDAAVIDMLLGDEFGGRDLYQILLTTKPGLAAKSLFITGDTMNYETRRFLSEAKRPFLEKPFMISDFTARLEEIMGTSTP
jgi:nitrogen-specific signal transduction histidine kinase